MLQWSLRAVGTARKKPLIVRTRLRSTYKTGFFWTGSGLCFESTRIKELTSASSWQSNSSEFQLLCRQWRCKQCPCLIRCICLSQLTKKMVMEPSASPHNTVCLPCPSCFSIRSNLNPCCITVSEINVLISFFVLLLITGLCLAKCSRWIDFTSHSHFLPIMQVLS